MPVDQYAYFALSSERTSTREMTDFLGVEPDERAVRGSRTTEPMLPVCHSWKVVCRTSGLRIDEQIAQIVGRLRPHTARITELVRQLEQEPEPGNAAVLQIVRYFSQPADSDSNTTAGPNLFGWHLDRDVLDFLTSTGTVLDVDEYDMTSSAAAES
ncbi:DUF4279 domain-containing protein [Streptomyces sp. NPDC004732]|uniref:DUF4279 domain-containing protein n=1 Tax=Streptomyces sp. NPDC004732 TaxID=3154290 RepID=UPI0033ACEC94